jgi:hypothetical protein
MEIADELSEDDDRTYVEESDNDDDGDGDVEEEGENDENNEQDKVKENSESHADVYRRRSWKPSAK